MAINEQIEAAWIEYVNDMDEDVRQTVAFHSDVFAAGYRAALRGLFTEANQDNCFEYSSVPVMVQIECGWREGLYDPLEDVVWVKVDKAGSYRIEKRDCTRVMLKGSFPSPAEVFGEDLLRKTQAE